MSSYFQSIRRLKDSHFYINALANQFALWKATQDQVDNPIYKAFSRATTNRLIFREQAAAPVLRGAEFWKPMVPSEPGPVGPIGAPPTGTITVMINFDHELEDRSGKKNHAIFEFTNAQLLFADGQNQDLSFAVNFNPNSNSTYDKLWIPFSPTTQIVYDTPTGFSIFARIMPLVTDDLGGIVSGGGDPPPVLRTNRIAYYGGPVFNKHKVAVYNIFWGSGWNDSTAETFLGGDTLNGPSLRSAIITGCQNIANSEYWDGLWSYSRGFQGISIGGNFTNTTVPFPMAPGQNLPNVGFGTGEAAEAVIIAEKNLGHVPNWDSFGEQITDKDGAILQPPNFNGQYDYTHLYFVHLDPRYHSIEGSGGFAWRSYTPGPPPGTVWYSYCVLAATPPEHVTSGRTSANHSQQAWAHELFHQIGEGPGFHTCTQGYTGFNYHVGSECTWISHSSADCQTNMRFISGTNTMVPHYWSDVDGRCICPGTGASWTRPPAGAPPQQTGPIIRRYIFQKLDDLDNGATAALGSSGTIFFNVKKAGIEYKVKTAGGIVRPNEWADCWFTWDTATNTPAIYINNVKYTTASTEALAWNNTHSHCILGNYNMGATVGQFRGRMDDFRLYRGALVEDAQVDNMAGNGLTITGGLSSPPNPDEGVFIVNRVKIDKQLQNTGVFVPGDVASGDVPSAIASFTTTSFTSTSFTL